MPTEHYFSSTPAGDANLRPLRVHLAGADRELTTASGIFSPDRVDVGTTVLLKSVPAPPTTGTMLDLGSGWGPLALTLALEAPAAEVWAVDVNERALDLVRRNATTVGAENLHAALPDEVPVELQFDLIWSNPPIRIGKPALHELLSRWLPRLAPGGEAWLVVARDLGADSLLRWLQDEFAASIEASSIEAPAVEAASVKNPAIEFERVDQSKGFRILRGIRR